MENPTVKQIADLIKTRRNKYILVSVIMSAVLFACSHTEKVLVPPRVELGAYRNVGVIEFSTNADENLKQYVTQNFIQNVQSAQPRTRILELGSQEHVLRSIKRQRFDLESIKSIGKKFNVDVVVLGHLEVSEIKPGIKVFSLTEALQAKAYVEALLNTRLFDTENGATLWTNATSGKTSVARVNLKKDGPFSFGVSDPKEKYGKLVPELVYVNTTDFRCQYEYRKVK